MKKYLFIGLLISISVFASKAQLKIYNPYNKTIVNDSTIVLWGNSTDEMNLNLYIINSTPVSVSLYARRDSISLPMADTDNTFCWGGACWPNTVNVSPSPETVGIGDTSNTIASPEFSSHYFPYGNIATAIMRYTFYNSSNHSDSVWVLVHYVSTPAGVSGLSENRVSFNAPYPNPAKNITTINYTFTGTVNTATLKVFNTLGACVENIPLNPAKNFTTLNVSSLPSGMYVCEIETAGYRPEFQKLMVAH